VYALADCRASLTRLQALSPGDPEARLLEIGLHGRIGDAHAHLAALEEAYASGDPLSRLASSVAMTALYDDRLSAAEVAALHRCLCAPIEASVRESTHFANPHVTERRLRIGYVTGDLHRQHPVNLFLLPVLLRHDRERFAICLYHTGSMYDGYTRLAQRRCRRLARSRAARRHEPAAGDRHRPDRRPDRPRRPHLVAPPRPLRAARRAGAGHLPRLSALDRPVAHRLADRRRHRRARRARRTVQRRHRPTAGRASSAGRRSTTTPCQPRGPPTRRSSSPRSTTR
jgi:hypothetical protein